MPRQTNIALAVVWIAVACFVLGDLGEWVRGDRHLVHLIPWDLIGGAIVSVVIVGAYAVRQRRSDVE